MDVCQTDASAYGCPQGRGLQAGVRALSVDLIHALIMHAPIKGACNATESSSGMPAVGGNTTDIVIYCGTYCSSSLIVRPM